MLISFYRLRFWKLLSPTQFIFFEGVLADAKLFSINYDAFHKSSINFHTVPNLQQKKKWEYLVLDSTFNVD